MASIDQYPKAVLRLGDTAPDFTAETSTGKINFHEYIGDGWVVLLSHPGDNTPVCTTELGAFALLESEFAKRNTKLLGLSVDDPSSHREWVKDINEVTGSNLTFPIVADTDRKVSVAYGMLDQDATNVDAKGLPLTVRSVFIISPDKKVRLILTYPASLGRNSLEVLRALIGLQTGDKYGVACPINWVGKNAQGKPDDAIVPVTVSDEAAKTKFPEARAIKPYLRFTPLPADAEY